MSVIDPSLLQQAVEGDAAALRTLLVHFGGEVRQRISGRIEKRWRASLDEDDVMQVAYLEAFLHIDQLTARDSASFLAWLTRIAENARRDAIRGLSRQKRPDPVRRVVATPDADSYIGLLECLGVTTTTPSREAARRDATAILESAIARLPEDYRTAVRLYDLEGRPISEVAAGMGRSVGAVHMLRARAHDRLRLDLGTSSQFFSGSA
ncbi:MAG: sigma-70 family RNA polymerase sigma factor [Planctomycetes bacterium]|nr:sigma-70 family RNA polymerase sigma factor [Planctomycetota bacterium]